MVLKNFFVLEGIDGCGKTTQIEALKATLPQDEYVFTAEPTKNSLGTMLRQVLSGKLPLSEEATAFLFAADRAEHIYGQEGILKTLSENKKIVCDRYLFSSLAYQSLGNEHFNFSEYANGNFPLPEKVFFLKLPVDVALSRLDTRDAREIFENKEKLTKISLSYENIFKKLKEKNPEMDVIVLDATKFPETLTEEIITSIK